MIIATAKSASEPLALTDHPSRPLQKKELRVQVKAIGVNPVDWKMREGGFVRILHNVLGPSGPLVVGVDFAGIVIEVSPDVREFSVGQHVVGGVNFARNQFGSYASEVIVRADQLVVLPEHVKFPEAASLPIAGVTAWQALTTVGKLEQNPSRKVLVLGASGGVGHFAIQLAKNEFQAQVTGVCSAKNAPMVTPYAHVLDYASSSFHDELKADGPYDLVINAVGSASYSIELCESLLKPKGYHALIIVTGCDVASLLFSNKSRGSLARVTSKALLPLVRALADGKLFPRIEATYSLAEAEMAHAHSRTGKVAGKLLIVP